MVSADALTFEEFRMREPLPLATVHNAILNFLRDRQDAVVFGAHAVNAYVAEPRMTQYVDLLSTNAEAFAQALIDHLHSRFRIAVCIRRIDERRGLRLFQVRKTGNRHLVDIRPVEQLPQTERVAGVLVLAPVELIASKVVAYHHRRGQPKSGTDWRDLAMLLLAFPELKQEPGAVSERLRADGAAPDVLAVWRELVAQDIRPPDEDEDASDPGSLNQAL